MQLNYFYSKTNEFLHAHALRCGCFHMHYIIISNRRISSSSVCLSSHFVIRESIVRRMIRTLALSTSFSECSVGFASTAHFGIGTVLNEFSSKELGCNDNALLIGATLLEVEGSESVRVVKQEVVQILFSLPLVELSSL